MNDLQQQLHDRAAAKHVAVGEGTKRYKITFKPEVYALVQDAAAALNMYPSEVLEVLVLSALPLGVPKDGDAEPFADL